MDDMETIGIPDNDRSHLMESIKDLPLALTNYDNLKVREDAARAALEQSKSSQNGSSNNSSSNNGMNGTSLVPPLTVEKWLVDIKLEEYKDIFK